MRQQRGQFKNLKYTRSKKIVIGSVELLDNNRYYVSFSLNFLPVERNGSGSKHPGPEIFMGLVKKKFKFLWF